MQKSKGIIPGSNPYNPPSPDAKKADAIMRKGGTRNQVKGKFNAASKGAYGKPNKTASSSPQFKPVNQKGKAPAPLASRTSRETNEFVQEILDQRRGKMPAVQQRAASAFKQKDYRLEKSARAAMDLALLKQKQKDKE